MDIIEGVRVAIKEMMIPELDRIREDNKEIKATLAMINKRLDDVNLHLSDQSRRIDAVREELGCRIDAVREEMSGRIDLLSGRIDAVREELGARIDNAITMIQETNNRIDSMAQRFDIRMDRLYEVIVRRDEHALAERRIAALEKDMAEIRLRLAA
jgi:transcription antitermination factor NusA-like protein